MSNEAIHEQREIPANAARLCVGTFEIGDNGENAKTAPLRMVARSGQPIEHWYWGRVVHDLSGMRLSKPRVVVDYCHDDEQIIGYLNRFSTESGDLEVSGALVPYDRSDDKATEIIFKSRAGIPYEASIDFRGPLRIEELDAGVSAEVNGYTFEGPGTIIREWPLRAVAVCPHGADENTESVLSNGDKLTIHVSKRKATMSEEIRTEEAPEAVETVDTEVTPVETPPAAGDVVETEVDEVQASEPAAAGDGNESVPAAPGRRFLDAFGDRGGVWFAEGRTFEEATQLHVAALQEEIRQLREQLAAGGSERGGDGPLALSRELDPNKPRSLADVVRRKNSRA